MENLLLAKGCALQTPQFVIVSCEYSFYMLYCMIPDWFGSHLLFLFNTTLAPQRDAEGSLVWETCRLVTRWRYELRGSTALTQQCTYHADASCALRRSVINHCSSEFWPCVKLSEGVALTLRSINCQINHVPTENKSVLICSIMSKLIPVSNIRMA